MPLNGPSRKKLDDALERLNVQEVQSILLAYKDPNLKLPEGLPVQFQALYIAALQEERIATYFLLRHFKSNLTAHAINISLDLDKEDTYTLLMLASELGWHETVDILVSLPSTDVNKTSKTGASALKKALLLGHSECAKKLLTHPQIILEQTTTSQDDTTPFMEACISGLSEVIILMLEKGGVNVNHLLKSPDNIIHHEKFPYSTPLSFALIGVSNSGPCNLAAIKALIRHGAELTVQGVDLAHPNEVCAEIIAEVVPYLKRIKTLRASQGYVQTPELFKAKKAAFNAIEQNNANELASLLKKYPVLITGLDEFNDPPREGDTLLISATRKNAVDCVKMLLAAKANPSYAKYDSKGTALHAAAQLGHDAIGDLLLQAGANKEAQTIRGDTPLSMACERGRKNMSVLLLKAGANVNHISFGDGKSCLDSAVSMKHKEIETMLREQYAARTAADLKGQQNSGGAAALANGIPSNGKTTSTGTGSNPSTVTASSNKPAALPASTPPKPLPATPKTPGVIAASTGFLGSNAANGKSNGYPGVYSPSSMSRGGAAASPMSIPMAAGHANGSALGYTPPSPPKVT